MLTERQILPGVCGVFLAVAAAVVVCNWFDWDIFLSYAEVDRRAWLDDHELPLWSYQLCAGVTRIGDPQSFGLSPLFALVIAFGSFWGSKLLVLVSMAIGLVASAGLLDLFASAGGGERLSRAQRYSLAAPLVFGNYFLWHVLVGHMTYTAIYLGLAIALFTVKGYLTGLRRAEFALGVLIAWQLYSASFFHVTAYLMIPFLLSFALFVALRRLPALAAPLPGDRSEWRRLASASGFSRARPGAGGLQADRRLVAPRRLPAAPGRRGRSHGDPPVPRLPAAAHLERPVAAGGR